MAICSMGSKLPLHRSKVGIWNPCEIGSSIILLTNGDFRNGSLGCFSYLISFFMSSSHLSISKS